MQNNLLPIDDLAGHISHIPKIFYSGRVNRVVGLIVEGYLPGVPVGGSCKIHLGSDESSLMAEVIGLKGENVILMPIGSTAGIKVGDLIEPIAQESNVKVSEAMLGRVIDGSGMPIDGLGEIPEDKEYPLYRESVGPLTRKRIQYPMPLGVRAIDGLMTAGMGQRLAIMAGSGVGKSKLMGMIARNSIADINVIGLIGERGREVREFIENDLGPEGLAKSVVVVATSDAPALVRMRSAFVATSIAEYFRDKGQRVMLMVDSLTRFSMAAREIGLSLGEPPTTKGYTPTIFSLLPKLLERAGTTDGPGSITGLYTILTEGDDLQDPIADSVRSIVDGHIVLSRKLTTEGHYPPIDILASLSRVMDSVISEEQLAKAQAVRKLMASYAEMEDYINMGVYTPGKNPELDLAISKRNEILAFLRQGMSERTPYQQIDAMLSKICMGIQL